MSLVTCGFQSILLLRQLSSLSELGKEKRINQNELNWTIRMIIINTTQTNLDPDDAVKTYTTKLGYTKESYVAWINQAKIVSGACGHDMPD
jgi:hypothetical protein